MYIAFLKFGFCIWRDSSLRIWYPRNVRLVGELWEVTIEMLFISFFILSSLLLGFHLEQNPILIQGILLIHST